jgi:lysozyme family protein
MSTNESHVAGSGSTFDQAVQHVLAAEGGGTITEDPRDPGGLTKYGISLRAYPSFRADGIRSLTEAEAIAIYKRDYWDWLKCDQLPARVAFILFDAAVNQGQPTAAKLLQLACNVHADGIIGDETLRAAQAVDPATLTSERILRYAQAQGFVVYGRGWIKRSISTLVKALSL